MSDKLTEKQSAFSRYMFTPGSESFGNGTESARKAGHKGTDNYLARVASENVRKCNIIAEKERIQRKSERKLNINRDYCIKKAYDILENGKAERNRLTALSLLGDFIGAKRESAPNAEREAARKARMDAEKRRVAEKVAKLRTEEESGEPKTIKIRA